MTTTGKAFGVGTVGALALGAGVYAVWITENPMQYGNVLVAFGAALFVLGLWLGEHWGHPIRISDTGVAAERGREVETLRWCDLERVFVENKDLVARSKEGESLTISLKTQPLAAAWVLREVARRVPDAMDVKRSVVDSLPKPDPKDGELIPAQPVQVAGRACAASGEPVTLERDARVCPTCAQVYHRDHVPRKCVTCGGALEDER